MSWQVSGLETTVFFLFLFWRLDVLNMFYRANGWGEGKEVGIKLWPCAWQVNATPLLQGEQCCQGCNLGGSSPCLCLLQLLETAHILGHELPSPQLLSDFDPLFYLLYGPFWFQPAGEDNLITSTVIDSWCTCIVALPMLSPVAHKFQSLGSRHLWKTIILSTIMT